MIDNCSNNLCIKKASVLQCPTCVKLNLKPHYYCSQSCFNESWQVHKLVHTDTRFENFCYSGKIKKGFVSPMANVPVQIVRPDYANHPQGISVLELQSRKNNKIPIYNQTDISKIRAVCKIGREIMNAVSKIVAAGITSNDIDQFVHKMCIENNCYPSPLNYYSFPKSCCVSINEVICHGIPDDTVICDGDIVNVDITIYRDGFHADLNETFIVGNVDQDSKRLVRTTLECIESAIAICKPGVAYRTIGDTIQKYAEKNGLSVVRSYCGHGVGKLFHDNPTIPHYGKNKAKGYMMPGHVFTIEPMLNLGTYEDITWPDNWTAVTKDGTRSAQFEHTILITDTGAEILTK